MSTPKEVLIAGYVEELRQYEAKGDEAGVKAVRAELRKLGADAKPPAARAETRPAKPKEVFPELADKEWSRGEKDSAETLKEGVEEAEQKPSAGQAKRAKK